MQSLTPKTSKSRKPAAPSDLPKIAEKIGRLKNDQDYTWKTLQEQQVLVETELKHIQEKLSDLETKISTKSADYKAIKKAQSELSPKLKSMVRKIEEYQESSNHLTVKVLPEWNTKLTEVASKTKKEDPHYALLEPTRVHMQAIIDNVEQCNDLLAQRGQSCQNCVERLEKLIKPVQAKHCLDKLSSTAKTQVETLDKINKLYAGEEKPVEVRTELLLLKSQYGQVSKLLDLATVSAQLVEPNPLEQGVHIHVEPSGKPTTSTT